MSQEDVQKEINDLRKAIDSLKREFSKDITSLKKDFEKDLSALEVKMEDMKVQSRDTYLKAQDAKHAADNVKGDLMGFTKLFERNQEAIQVNQKSITEIVSTAKEDRIVLQEILKWFNRFKELATFPGWEEHLKETKENTNFRKMFGSWYSGLLGIAALFAAILAALAFAKKIGL